MTMSPLDRLLQEWEYQRHESTDPELAALRLALLIEDVLGVTLADQQISREFLLDRNALRSLVVEAATPR